MLESKKIDKSKDEEAKKSTKSKNKEGAVDMSVSISDVFSYFAMLCSNSITKSKRRRHQRQTTLTLAASCKTILAMIRDSMRKSRVLRTEGHGRLELSVHTDQADYDRFQVPSCHV